MPGDYHRWTDEEKEQLVSLYRRNFTPLEIAERLGLDYEQVKRAISSAKKGKWGAYYQARVLFQDSPEPSEAEEDTPAGIVEETSCRQVSASHNGADSAAATDESAATESSKPTRISMIGAIDELTVCAQLFGSDEITGLFAAPRTGVAQISFRVGSSEYLLELKNEGEIE